MIELNHAWTKNGQSQKPMQEPHFTIKLSAPTLDKTSHNVEGDEHILHRVQEALRESGYEQLRSIQAYCHHGRVVLQGRITTYFLKQVAQEVVRVISGVRDIDNDLRVICSC